MIVWKERDGSCGTWRCFRHDLFPAAAVPSRKAASRAPRPSDVWRTGGLIRKGPEVRVSVSLDGPTAMTQQSTVNNKLRPATRGATHSVASGLFKNQPGKWNINDFHVCIQQVVPLSVFLSLCIFCCWLLSPCGPDRRSSSPTRWYEGGQRSPPLVVFLKSP